MSTTSGQHRTKPTDCTDEELHRILKLVSWSLHPNVLAVMNIPILEVANKLQITYVSRGNGENITRPLGIHELAADINEKTNRWHFEWDWRNSDFPYDYFESKTNIDLVIVVEEYTFLEAVEFLQNEFPDHSGDFLPRILPCH